MIQHFAGRFAALVLFAVSPIPIARAAPPQQLAANRAQIWVRFVDDSGKPVPGVELKQSSPSGHSRTLGTSTNDGLLVAEFDWTWPGESRPWNGTAEHFGHAVVPVSARLVKGREADVGEIKLAPGGAVSGRVFGADGKALEDVSVLVVPSQDRDEPSARLHTTDDTKPDGSYRVVGLAPGSYRVWAKHDSSSWAKVENVLIEAGKEATGVDVKVEYLADEYRIAGTVVDPNGQPVAGAELRIAIPDTDGAGTLVSRAKSDAQGKFKIYLTVHPTAPFLIEVNDPQNRWSEFAFGDAVPGDRDVVLKFSAPVELSLKVLDSNGAPVEEFGWAMRVDHGKRDKLEEALPAPHPGGVAKIRGPVSPFRLEVRSRLYESKSIGPFDPTALPASTEVRLLRLPCITGKVTHAGKPLAGAIVALVRPSVNPMAAVDPEFVTSRYTPVGDVTAVTDAEGRFALPAKQRTPDGRVLASSDQASEAVSAPAQAGGVELAIELGNGGVVEGAVTLPPGVEPSNALIELYRERDDRRIRRTVDASGKWRCEHLAPGPWLANVVFVPPPATARRTTAVPVGASKQPPYVFEITEGGTTKRDLDFSRDALCRVTGALTVAAKPPGKAIATMYTSTMPALEISACNVGEDGRVTLAAREPGTYRIAWRGEGSKFSKNVVVERVTLAAGDNAWTRDLSEEEWRVHGINLTK